MEKDLSAQACELLLYCRVTSIYMMQKYKQNMTDDVYMAWEQMNWTDRSYSFMQRLQYKHVEMHLSTFNMLVCWRYLSSSPPLLLSSVYASVHVTATSVTK